jgi:hypothetical protein
VDPLKLFLAGHQGEPYKRICYQPKSVKVMISGQFEELQPFGFLSILTIAFNYRSFMAQIKIIKNESQAIFL